MKRNLLSIAIMFLLGLSLNAQQMLSVKIIETQKDGDVSISFDDGEFENDAVDKMDDDDLDMGWEGEDGNIMTTFTRFQKVTIPQGAIIDSAFLNLYAHEDEPDEAKVNIYAEATDNSAIFTEAELINTRTWTAAKIDWDIKEPWTMWKPYRSPDLKTVIQEVISRTGWVSGNSLTLFFKGEDQGASLLDNARDFESFENIEDPADGGDGLHHPERVPTLMVYYSIPSAVSQVNIRSMSVYPNPSEDGIFTISSEKPLSGISIYNVAGVLVKFVKADSDIVSVNASDLSKGMYLIKATSSDKTNIEKFIIK
jgi:hypothetical protein